MAGAGAAAGSVRPFTGDLGFRTGTLHARADKRKTDGTRRRAMALLAACVLVSVSIGVVLGGLGAGSEGRELKARTSYTTHATILIFDDSDFTALNGVTGGSGTASNPYIIEGWEIDASVMGFGVYIAMTTAHYVIRGVHAYGSESIGVALYGAPNGTVTGCVMDEGDVGMIAIECADLNISDNDISNQAYFGIELYTCGRTNVSGNTASNTDGAGIVCIDIGDVSIESNTCTISAICGIMVMEADGCRIANNTASGNGFFGIGANDTRELTIQGNEVSYNSEYGLILGNSTGVRVFHNVFTDNGVQAWHENCRVTWDDGYPSGGNYWSDYTGPDDFNGPDQDLPGADGIGDTAYVTEGGGIDRYPWMTPDMEFIPEFGAALVPVLIVVCALPIVMHRRRLLSSERR